MRSHTEPEAARESAREAESASGSSPDVQSGATHRYVEVDTLAGRVRGAWRERPADAGAGGAPERSAAFLGIPFAEPPVGELCFMAPVPKRPWPGVLDALEFGATAQRGDPGVTLIPEPSVPGESTLNVNVFTPSPERAARGEGLPVLVWIHGGGYFAGSPASPWYDGRAFNRDGVVTVTISYRLGFDGFGWMEGSDAPTNRGVRDWLLALEWVRDNIAAFGGDPERVTIAGQSAGGGAVLTLLGMPAAQHLFHGVYALSGATADVTTEHARALSRELAARGGVAPTLEGFSSLPEERVLELQAAVTALDGPNAMTDLLDRGLALGPTIDGELVERPTEESIAAGVGADKPLVLGATDDEFAMALEGAPWFLRLVPAAVLLRRSGLAKELVRPYLRANRDVVALGGARLLGRYVSDRMFKAPALRIAAARGAAPTWLYRFAWPSGRFGYAEHCLDVPFFFDCLDGPAIEPLAGANPPASLARELHAAAVAFVRSGDPGDPGAAGGASDAWPRWTSDARRAQVWDAPSRVEADAFASVAPLV